MVKSRRIKQISEEDTTLPSGFCYCRTCQKIKRQVDFFKAVDEVLDSNGFFSVCKTCVDSLYNKVLEVEHGSVHKATLHLCRKLNVQYNEQAINSALQQIETRGWSEEKFFGVYRAKLLAVGRFMTDTPLNLQYEDNPVVNIPETKMEDDTVEIKDLKLFWGTDVKEDLEFLEMNFSKFKQSHKADTYAEIVLLKEVCFKMLEINNERKLNGKVPDSSTKQLMDIMKSLAISPNMVSAANSGKNMDTFGVWLREIETMRPAEWVEDKSAYKDVDDIEAYGEKYLTSPMRSLVTGNREFSLDDNSDSGDFSEDE